MVYDEVYFIHLPPGVVHNFPKVVDVDLCPLRKRRSHNSFEKSAGGRLRYFLFHVSAVGGSTLPQDLWKNSFAEH